MQLYICILYITGKQHICCHDHIDTLSTITQNKHKKYFTQQQRKSHCNRYNLMIISAYSLLNTSHATLATIFSKHIIIKLLKCYMSKNETKQKQLKQNKIKYS